MVQLFLKQITIAQRVIQIDLKVTMNMTGSPLIKLNLLHKNEATQLKSHYFKLLRVHLSIVSFHVKKKYTDLSIPSQYRVYLSI